MTSARSSPSSNDHPEIMSEEESADLSSLLSEWSLMPEPDACTSELGDEGGQASRPAPRWPPSGI